MSQTQQATAFTGRRASIPYEMIGQRQRIPDSTTPDKCPCCGAFLDAGNVRVDLSSNSLIVDQKLIRLRPKEAELMAVLVAAFPNVATIDSMVAGIWGQREPEAANSSVKMYVFRLRQKLIGTGVSIANVLNVGYRVVLR